MQRGAITSISSWCLIIFSLLSAAGSTAEDLGAIPKSAETVILRNPGTPRAGSKDPDVILVEFFDYNCPFCKQLNPALEALLKADPKVALVHKDWPILSEASRYGAERALAANWQGKYLTAHDTLMGATRLASIEQIDKLLRDAGLDMNVLNKDLAAHTAEIMALLQRNDTEARAIGLRGTPGLLIGGHIISGVYDVAGLERAVQRARHDAAR
jgi:protein-disulfide isomerase